MSELKSVEFGCGSVVYVRKIEGRPETIERDGSVTVHNSAIPSRPAHYEVTFMLNSSFEHVGLPISNIFHWSCIVEEQSDRAPYRSVEDKAARQIAPMLRSLADKIEADLPNFDDQGV